MNTMLSTASQQAEWQSKHALCPPELLLSCLDMRHACTLSMGFSSMLPDSLPQRAASLA